MEYVLNSNHYVISTYLYLLTDKLGYMSICDIFYITKYSIGREVERIKYSIQYV